jgi:hypothetical protein
MQALALYQINKLRLRHIKGPDVLWSRRRMRLGLSTISIPMIQIRRQASRRVTDVRPVACMRGT